MSKDKVITMPRQSKDETYNISAITVEEAQRRVAEFEATPAGKRFLRSLELARDFAPRKTWAGLNLWQLFYLANKADATTPIDVIVDAANYAYRAGYMAAQRDAKKKG